LPALKIDQNFLSLHKINNVFKIAEKSSVRKNNFFLWQICNLTGYIWYKISKKDINQGIILFFKVII